VWLYCTVLYKYRAPLLTRAQETVDVSTRRQANVRLTAIHTNPVVIITSTVIMRIDDAIVLRITIKTNHTLRAPARRQATGRLMAVLVTPSREAIFVNEVPKAYESQKVLTPRIGTQLPARISGIQIRNPRFGDLYACPCHARRLNDCQYFGGMSKIWCGNILVQSAAADPTTASAVRTEEICMMARPAMRKVDRALNVYLPIVIFPTPVELYII